jgi:hypothetical protein
MVYPRQALIETGVQQLIGSPEEEGGHYFTIWAPRQTGKTWLMRQIQQAIELKYPDEFAVFNFSLGALRGMSFFLAPTRRRGYPSGRKRPVFVVARDAGASLMRSHAGAWEREKNST